MWSVVPGRTDKIAHAIETWTCRPVRQPSYRIPQVYKAEVQKMRQAGVIVPSTSEWSFPIVPVRKKDGSLCICIDYRRLNALSVGDVSWRCVSDANCLCQNSLLFPTWIVSVYARRPAPATFQRLMNSVIAGLDCRTRLLCCLFGRPDCVQRDLERAPGSSRTSIFKTQAGRLDSEGQQMPDWHEGV